MKIIKITLLAILILGILIVLYFYVLPRLAFFEPGSTSCSDELIGEYASPGSSVIARHVVKDCGATTDFSTNVNVDENTALRIKGYHTDDIEIVWEDGINLKIKYKGDENLIQLFNKGLPAWQVPLVLSLRSQYQH